MQNLLQPKHRRLAPGVAFALLALHGCAGFLAPVRASFWSTLGLITIELMAMFACLGSSLRSGGSPRILWRLAAFGLALVTVGEGIVLDTQYHGTASNPVPGLPILLSSLYAVPLLMALSTQFDARIQRPIRVIYQILSVMTGVLFCVLIFSVVSIEGSTNLSDILFVSHMFDALDVFLAIAASIRLAGAEDSQECFFFYVMSAFLWATMVLSAIHNRILIRHDYVWLDLLISTPYLMLLTMVFQVPPRWVRYPRPPHWMYRMVRSGSPIFLSLGLLLLGIVVSRTHFYVGAAGVLAAIICYGALNVLAQSRGLEVQESLLASKRELEELVSLDSLTGIPNRRAFDERIDVMCRTAYRFSQPVSLLMIDIDFFKQLNDSRGHLMGDMYLMRIARELHGAVLRAGDFVARYGGEEFAVLLPGTPEAGASRMAARLQEAVAGLGLEHPSTPSGLVTISIGGATANAATPPAPFDMIETADRALYRAKSLGRNRAEFLPLGSESANFYTDRMRPMV